jgi:hypothetical protein
MGLEKGLPPGEQLLLLFRPFLEYLATSDLSPKTIQKHIDNMWALGGEFIRELHSDSSLRKKPVERVLSSMIEYGGPLPCHGGEDQQRSFDSTCAESSGVSSQQRLADAPSPTNSPDEGEIKERLFALIADCHTMMVPVELMNLWCLASTAHLPLQSYESCKNCNCLAPSYGQFHEPSTTS